MIQIRDISTIELDINGEKRKVTVGPQIHYYIP